MGSKEASKRYRERHREKVREIQRAWNSANRERVTAYGRNRSRRRAGFTEDRFAITASLQGRACAICRTPFDSLPSKHVHADHDHSTGEARGVLCKNCNLGLGVFKDSPALLSAAINYLAKPPSKEVIVLEPKIDELKAAVEANTAMLRELTAALIASGALQTAQASAALHSSPGVQAVATAQRQLKEKEADAAKKQDAATDANAGAAATTESKPSGATSAPTPGKSSDVPPSGELKPWADKTAEIYAELKDAEPTAENVKRLIVFGINQKIPGEGRAIAEAVLARFGANAVSEKPGKKGLSEDQYADVLAYGLRVLAGELDPRDAETTE
ncbi:hypothetical protein KPA96_19395 [Burkholderia cenocepacia]|uniref:endonuclease domain-containing protein n=1 Tax=Burkholderia cenocepacia TaxID=95486 RepID=UPI0028662938|nr:endonuclease domain-containing protein [Burkholderia cenocepacia]MDR8077823.1 hypothetical protein [Burkholderia cenocepacia]